MAIILSTDSLIVTTLRRTWRINVEVVLGADHVLTAHRELVKRAGDIVLSKDQNAGTITRTLSAVAAEMVELDDGTILTPAHVAEALAVLIERWEVEDLTPPTTPEPTP